MHTVQRWLSLYRDVIVFQRYVYVDSFSLDNDGKGAKVVPGTLYFRKALDDKMFSGKYFFGTGDLNLPIFWKSRALSKSRIPCANSALFTGIYLVRISLF